MIPFSAEAQEDQGLLLEQLFEHISDEYDEDIDLSYLMEVLDGFAAHPLDINQVNAEDLQELLFLSPLLIQKILEYRRLTGGFVSIHELQAIDGMEPALARLLSRYLVVKEASSMQGIAVQSLAGDGAHDLMLRYGRVLQKSAGYNVKEETRSRYLGSPDRLMVRYRYAFNQDLKIAVNLEKDPGEQFFKGRQKLGFDYASASIQLKNQGHLTNVVLGDYSLQFGQGLGLWMGYGLGKSSILHAIAKQGAGIKPHTSFDEANFLRGLTGTVRLNQMEITPYFSMRRRDGNMQAGPDGTIYVASLGKSGLHRTPSEVRNKNAVREGVVGTNVLWRGNQWRAGANVFYTWYPVKIDPQPLPRNYFMFRGQSFSHMSLYYHASLSAGYFFGEAAYLIGGGLATVQGAMLSVGRQLSLGAVYRYYQESHHSPFARPFGEGSTASNESGFYLALSYQPNRRLTWVVYVDRFSFPWLKYRIDSPSKGMDVLSQWTYSWTRDSKIAIRYRFKKKDENLAIQMPHQFVAETQKNQIRVDFQSNLASRDFSIRSRLEGSWFVKESLMPEFGWMYYQDVFYKMGNGKLNLNARIAYFQTSGSNTRLYVFESDVLYAHASTFYQYKGWRVYANTRWRLSRNIDFWLKYAYSVYQDREEVGTGLDLIAHSGRSELKSQLRYRF